MFFFLLFFSFSDLTTSSSCGASFSESKISFQKRDPFYVSDAVVRKKVHYFVREPRVLGIMTFGGARTALINFGDTSKIIRQGDKVNGYTILHIHETCIHVLTPGKEEVQWSM